MTALDFWRNESPRSLAKRDPWRSLFTDFEEFFENGKAREGFLTPAVDIKEDENEFTLSFDAPGVDKKDINLEVVGNSLVVSGERKREKEEKGQIHRIEREYGSFKRSFTLPENVVRDKIKADYKKGELIVSLPKKAIEKPQKITIS